MHARNRPCLATWSRDLSRRVATEEGGFSLVELLVVVALLSFVLAATLGIFDVAVRQAPRDQERAHAIREAQVGLYAMTRELRQAYEVKSVSGSQMDVLVRLRGVDKRVRYRCDGDPSNPAFPSYRRCVREEASASPGAVLGAPQIVIDRVLNGASVFSPTFAGTPAVSPAYFTARIQVPARGRLKTGYTSSVVLDDGVFLRNLK